MATFETVHVLTFIATLPTPCLILSILYLVCLSARLPATHHTLHYTHHRSRLSAAVSEATAPAQAERDSLQQQQDTLQVMRFAVWLVGWLGGSLHWLVCWVRMFFGTASFLSRFTTSQLTSHSFNVRCVSHKHTTQTPNTQQQAEVDELRAQLAAKEQQLSAAVEAVAAADQQITAAAAAFEDEEARVAAAAAELESVQAEAAAAEAAAAAAAAAVVAAVEAMQVQQQQLEAQVSLDCCACVCQASQKYV